MGAYHSTGYSLKSGVTGDFHRPYETQNFLPVSTRERYRVGQGTHVWEPAECVTKNPLDGMYSGFWREGRGYSAEMR